MSVTVILPDNKRLSIKVTVNSLLSEVLEKACTHKGFDSNEYSLHRNDRPVDLGLSLRLSGIPLNSELELVLDEAKKKRNAGANSAPQVVNISVQFGELPRRVGDFPCTQTLMGVIEALFAADCSEVADDQVLLSINYMNRRFEGKEVLAATTLKLIGITSGRQLLRLHARSKDTKVEQKFTENFKYKQPEVAVKAPEEKVVKVEEKEVLPSKAVDHEMKEELPETKQTEEKFSAPTNAAQSKSFGTQGRSLTEQFKVMKEEASKKRAESGGAGSSTKPITTTVNLDSLKEVKYLGGNHEEILYSIAETPAFVEEKESDDFFEHTASDLKALLKALKREQLGGNTQMPLLETEKLREERLKRERAKYPKTILRVLFHADRLVLQGLFSPTDTVADVMTMVGKYINTNNHFHLFTAPPRVTLSPDTSLFDLKLVPTGLVYFGSNAGAFTLPVISPQYSSLVTPYSIAANLSLHQLKNIYQKAREGQQNY